MCEKLIVTYDEVMILRYPSFTSLTAFDAAARLGSFTKAAQEQNVSQPAISRRVAMLEAELGRGLFDRSTKPMNLTPAGERLFDTLRTSFGRLQMVMDEIRAEGATPTVSISGGSGFSTYWLLPKLPALQEAHPDVKIRIVSETGESLYPTGDIQVRFGGGEWPGFTSTKVLGESVFPVCSPLYLKGRAPLFPVENLANERLLQFELGRLVWYDWPSWFDAIGLAWSPKIATTNFNSYGVTVAAALAGSGICLSWGGLLDTFLDSGALVRVTDASASSERGYFLTYAEDLPEMSPTRMVAEQIIQLSN
jgi:LysR family glycine cleavage system transcriptional activator